MTLAAILLKFPSDVITNEIPEAALLRFLKGKDQISGLTLTQSNEKQVR